MPILTAQMIPAASGFSQSENKADVSQFKTYLTESDDDKIAARKSYEQALKTGEAFFYTHTWEELANISPGLSSAKELGNRGSSK